MNSSETITGRQRITHFMNDKTPSPIALVSDSDGVLADFYDEELVPGAREEITKWVTNSLPVYIITSRPPAWIKDVYDDLHDVDFFCRNGAIHLRNGVETIKPELQEGVEKIDTLFVMTQFHFRDVKNFRITHEVTAVGIGICGSDRAHQDMLLDEVHSWATETAAEHGLKLKSGEGYVDLCLPNEPTKYDALINDVLPRLKDSEVCKFVAVGDDRNDVLMFAGAEELHTDHGFMALKLCVGRDDRRDPPKELLVYADALVNSEKALVGLLGEIREAHTGDMARYVVKERMTRS